MISLILAKKILSLFLVMALGIVLVRCGIVRSRDSKVLSMISLYLVMPCVIISSFQVKYQPEILNGLLLALATAVLLHLVLIVVVGFLGKVLKLDGVEETSLIYSNAGNLIIPIVTAILGKEWVIYTSAFLSVQLFLLSGAPATTHAAASPRPPRAMRPRPTTKSRIASSVGKTRLAHSRAASFSSNLRI